MLKKALTKSGLRILKAIKKFSTRTKKTVKNVPKLKIGTSSWCSVNLPSEFNDQPAAAAAVSLSWSFASLDTLKSVDTYFTTVSENLFDSMENCSIISNDQEDDDEKKICCCCCAAEYEENQRNENRENEMFV